MALFKPPKLSSWCITLILISFLAGSEMESDLARSYSILIDTPIEYSDLSVSTFSHSLVSQPGLTGNWWASPNLNLLGTIQPISNNSDISLYLNMGVSYLPGGTFFTQYAASIGFGMHRIRFKNANDYRYYHLKMAATIPSKHYNIKLDWQRLFDTKWHDDEFHIYLLKQLPWGLLLQIGSDIPLSLNTRLHPLISLSAAL